MGKKLISFVGLGWPPKCDEDYQKPGYKKASYAIVDTIITSRFSQRVIVESAGADTFDEIILLATSESARRHEAMLTEELMGIGVSGDAIRWDASLATNQNTDEQWQWFEGLVDYIHDGDEVIFDFTHGFRSVPIIFATAVGYIQRIRDFQLLHAFYGWAEPAGTDEPWNGRIIDMADFFRINQWAHAVGRLTESADPSGLIDMAQRDGMSAFRSLNDPELLDALSDMAQKVKDIHANEVGPAVERALVLLDTKIAVATGADRQLLELVRQKFGRLGGLAEFGSYDKSYFELQFELAQLLLDHKLFVQAYTVMREAAASLCMLAPSIQRSLKDRAGSSRNRGKRKRAGEIFSAMLQNDRVNWRFNETHASLVAQIEPLVAQLEDARTNTSGTVAEHLGCVMKTIAKARNGFNHAWIDTAVIPASVHTDSMELLVQLRALHIQVREAARNITPN